MTGRPGKVLPGGSGTYVVSSDEVSIEGGTGVKARDEGTGTVDDELQVEESILTFWRNYLDDGEEVREGSERRVPYGTYTDWEGTLLLTRLFGLS